MTNSCIRISVLKGVKPLGSYKFPSIMDVMKSEASLGDTVNLVPLQRPVAGLILRSSIIVVPILSAKIYH